MKKRMTFTIDEKWINKLGAERNKSKIADAALAKYFNEERQNYKNDLQIIREFDKSVNNLNSNLEIKLKSIKQILNLVFNMTSISSNLADVVILNNKDKVKDVAEKKNLKETIIEIQEEFKKIFNMEV